MKIIAALLLFCFCIGSQGADRPPNRPTGRPAVRIPQQTPPRRPNIILIVANDLGYGDIGAYGQKKFKTPNLDKMAEEGTLFSQYYAGGAAGAPTRASLLTGMHTGHSRIRGEGSMPLAPEDVTVAAILRTAGYQTAATGIWGLGLEGSSSLPNDKGFHEWFGFLDALDATNDYPDFIWRNKDKHVMQGNIGGRQGDYAADWFMRIAHNFIRINEDRSFFLYLSFNLPHPIKEINSKTPPVPGASSYSKESWPDLEKYKAAMIARLDGDVGKIMASLKEYHVDEQTIVFFTSDNGPYKEGGIDPEFFNSSGSLRGIKGDLYEGGIRVPMLVRWPGKVPAGKTNDLVWAACDFLPTAIQIAWGTPPENIDGISMLPSILGQPQPKQHDFLYWECHENGFKQAVRMQQWKGVKPAPDQSMELFDLSKDPGEKENVAAKNAEIVAKMENYLKTARTESAQWPVKGNKAD